METATVPLRARPLLEFTAAEAAAAMNRSFAQYLVPMVFTPASFERRFRGENLDAEASKLWFRGEELVGLVLIARRGWQSRVAGMGLVVGARGQGFGKVMLQAAIDEAAARGDRSLLLEVFTANEPARRLYTGLGFRNTRLLTTFGCPAATHAPAPAPLAAADPRLVARLLAQHGPADLPWMVAPETLAATAPPVQGVHLAHKAFAIVRAEATRTLLLGLVVLPEHRRQGWATRLLQAIESEYAFNNLLSYMVVEGPGYELLRSRRWVPQELTLWEMVRPV